MVQGQIARATGEGSTVTVSAANGYFFALAFFVDGEVPWRADVGFVADFAVEGLEFLPRCDAGDDMMVPNLQVKLPLPN